MADLALPARQGPRILIYHQVGSGRSHEMNVSVRSFRRHLDWMQLHGEIVSLENAIGRRAEPGSHRLFVLTFDDGYADVFFNAFPLLEAARIPFTLYLTSGPIENSDKFGEWPGQPLTWDQVRQMCDSGLVTLGAHTHSHPDLRELAPHALREELDRSNGLINTRCHVKPSHFTYPWGRWSATADSIIRETYATATLGSGPAVSADSDLYTLHRVPIQRSDPGLLFRRKILSGGRSEDRMRRMARGYDGP